jgi:hypothetical protein
VGRQTNQESGDLKSLFRTAAKAATRDEDADLEAEKRRRRGEAEGEFQKLTRKFSRQLESKRETPADDTTTAGRTWEVDAYEQAADCLSDTLDSLNLYYWEDSDPAEIDDNYSPPQDYCQLQL